VNVQRPASAVYNNSPNPNPFSPPTAAAANPFFPMGGVTAQQQPNLIVTAPLSGGYPGYNQPAANPSLNMNQPSNFTPNSNPFAPPSTGFNQGGNFNANMGFNNQPSNPYMAGGNNFIGNNPFTPNQGFNQGPIAAGSNPFVTPAQNNINSNPFLNNQNIF